MIANPPTKTNTKDEPLCWREDRFADNLGRCIVERTVQQAVRPPVDFPRFVGVEDVQVQTARGPVGVHLIFPIKADTVVMAYEQFESAAGPWRKKADADVKAQAAKSTIIQPGPRTR